VRLLTFIGPGGVGKTRLSLQVAAELQETFTHGCCFVSLDSLYDAELVLPAIVQALHLPIAGTLPLVEQAKDSLREQHLLLVLDNFEHVIVAAPLLVELLHVCPRLTLLVTSRETLRLRGERTFSVLPLAQPDLTPASEVQTMMRSGAVALFVARAQEILPTFQLTPENAPLVAEICQRLDGLPLALELAAVRLKLLPVPVLLEHLDHRLALLTGGPRDLPSRQRTLRATLTWSYKLLSQEEQRLFRWLSVFSGGGTLAAVEAVARLLGDETTSLMDRQISLLEKHLLSQTEQDRAEPRIRMLETTREYGWECLSRCEELEQTRQAHAQYYRQLAEDAETHLFQTEEAWWFDRLEHDQDNLRSALNWLLVQAEAGKCTSWREQALRLASSLIRFWIVRGHSLEGRTWIERALQESEEIDKAVQAKVFMGAGWLAFLHGDLEQAEVRCTRSLQLYREGDERRGMSWPLQWLGWIALRKGNELAASTFLAESHALGRNDNETDNLGYLLHFQAGNAIDQGAYEQAHHFLEESQALFQKENNQEGLAGSRRFAGRVLLRQGKETQAATLFEESLRMCQDIQHQGGLACSLHLLGRLARAQGDLSTAREVLEKSLHLFRVLVAPQATALVLAQLASIIALQEDAAAESLYQESLELFQQMNDPAGLAFCLQEWGILAARQGELIWATQLWGTADAISSAPYSHGPYTLSVERLETEIQDYERMVKAARDHLGKSVFLSAWAQGQTLTSEQVLAARGQPLILDQSLGKVRGKNQNQPAWSEKQALTTREQEVLGHVAQGLTDAQVAEVLVISPRTVNAHLRSIYRKLNVTSRYAAIYYALTRALP
jgi:predicted ATPase/DNA-binding CsgD family transcriptional regulator